MLTCAATRCSSEPDVERSRPVRDRERPFAVQLVSAHRTLTPATSISTPPHSIGPPRHERRRSRGRGSNTNRRPRVRAISATPPCGVAVNELPALSQRTPANRCKASLPACRYRGAWPTDRHQAARRPPRCEPTTPSVARVTIRFRAGSAAEDGESRHCRSSAPARRERAVPLHQRACMMKRPPAITRRIAAFEREAEPR